MGFNNLGFGTISPGGPPQRWWYSFGGNDMGAQYAMAHPLNPGGVLQVNNQTKVRNSDASITYWVTITNIGFATTNFSLSGGGLSNGFNNLGFGTISPGEPPQRWWYSYGGNDMGAQYAMAHPFSPGGLATAMLQVNNQTKARNPDGSITYWVTITNLGSATANFSLSGGGLSNGFNGVGSGVIGPGEPPQRWWYTRGDQGAQYAMAHPLDPGGVLQVNDQTKARNSDGSITYWVTITDIGSAVRTNFNLSGGGLS